MTDSPKAIIEAMKADTRFKWYMLVWASHEPEKVVVDGAEKIKTACFKYFRTALATRVKGRKPLYGKENYHG